MEPAQPSTDPEVPSGEDYVHIDDPRPDADASLSDSIVNVEKEELLQEAEEEKDEDGEGEGDSSSSSSASVSGISGGDALGVGGGDDIGGLVNVEKELLQDAEEEKAEGDSSYSASESGIRGGDVLGVGGADDICGVGDGGERPSEAEKVELPEELARSVVVLTCESTAEGGSCDVYLVGTAHVSQESCREVEAVVRFLKPQVVFLELCSSRLSVLKPQTLKVPTMAEMIDMWKKKHNTFGIIYSWFLAKIASKLEVFPGAEFRVAFEEAMKYGGKVVLGDRPVQITLRRTWAMMPLWHKAKFLYSLVFQAVFLPSPEELNKMLKDMDDVDMLTLVIQEMSKEFPSLMDTLVRERDQYMASSLLKVASEHSTVVAVIGKGHVQGIKKNWKQPITMNDLMEIPTQKSVFTAKKILASLAVAVAGTAIVSGIYLSSKR